MVKNKSKKRNNPKIVHGEDEEGIYILVSLPYVKKYGVLLDHTHNVTEFKLLKRKSI